MDESVVKHLEQPQVGTLKLSDLIRKGRPLIEAEHRHCFRFCALGCAFAGAKGRAMTPEEEASFCQKDVRTTPVAERIARAIGVPERAAILANEMHLFQSLLATAIADRLEAMGY